MFRNLMKKLKRSRPEEDYFALGHMIKYNVYLLSKSVIFSSLIEKHSGKDVSDSDIEKFARLTEAAMKELDLASKSN